MSRFLGKYRGTVLNNIDPLQRGRIQAQVPDVLGLVPSSWAMPCLPVAGLQSGWYAVPPVGAGVWVEFERGDPDYPIWVGCWWETAAEVPALALAPPPGVPRFVFQTTAQHTFVISDVPGPTGGFMLKTPTGALILVNDTGITLSTGKGATIVLTANSIVMNNGALVVQ